jgi:predicted dithiol-disulfide oxidoreductase (DUF899 family)
MCPACASAGVTAIAAVVSTAGQARKELLLEEKSYAKQGDALAARRRDLPWVRVDQEVRL